MNKIKERLSKLTDTQKIYIGIFCMWIAVGAVTIATSNEISLLSYISALLVLLLTCLDNIFKGR